MSGAAGLAARAPAEFFMTRQNVEAALGEETMQAREALRAAFGDRLVADDEKPSPNLKTPPSDCCRGRREDKSGCGGRQPDLSTDSARQVIRTPQRGGSYCEQLTRRRRGLPEH